jgi:hypothetical protein
MLYKWVGKLAHLHAPLEQGTGLLKQAQALAGLCGRVCHHLLIAQAPLHKASQKIEKLSSQLCGGTISGVYTLHDAGIGGLLRIV